MNTYQTIKNTGIAVILDCGEFNEIHPKIKNQLESVLHCKPFIIYTSKYQLAKPLGQFIDLLSIETVP